MCVYPSSVDEISSRPVEKLRVRADVAPRLAALVDDHYQTVFTSYVKRHSKKYPRDEFFPRYNIFKANFNRIRSVN